MLKNNDFIYSLRVLHGRIHEWFYCLRNITMPIIKKGLKDRKAVFLVFTPEHGNLGDHAIAKAESVLLGQIGVDYIEITGKQLDFFEKNNLFYVFGKRSVLVHGGGFLGTLWFNCEKTLRSFIKSRKKSKILCLPNTIYYENSGFGKEEFEKSKEVYNSHPNLALYAREKVSFEIMKNAYSNVKLVPDMVLSLNECKQNQNRSGCLLCLRQDSERTRSEETELTVRKQAIELFGEEVRDTDMCTPYLIPVSDRDKELDKKFDEFRSAELVITDRLHGMIFAAITGTPCIVIDSKSPKVRGCYEWIKNLPYIQFADNAADISAIYNSIPKKEWQYDNTKLLPYYEELKTDILDLLK